MLFYKKNYKKIETQEIYKWKAFMTFHENWDIDAPNFKKMLEESLKDTSNLMSASNYYPRRMILWMAEKDEETVREMFQNLYKFESLCNYVHNYVMHDAELLEMYETRREQHYDSDCHLLV